jgi:hypothetical protein
VGQGCLLYVPRQRIFHTFIFGVTRATLALRADGREKGLALDDRGPYPTDRRCDRRQLAGCGHRTLAVIASPVDPIADRRKGSHNGTAD